MKHRVRINEYQNLPRLERSLGGGQYVDLREATPEEEMLWEILQEVKRLNQHLASDKSRDDHEGSVPIPPTRPILGADLK